MQLPCDSASALIDVLFTTVIRQPHQIYRCIPHGQCNMDKRARFENIAHNATRLAIALRRTAFPGEVVTVSAVQGKATAEFSLLAGVLFSAPEVSCFRPLFEVRAFFIQAKSQHVVSEIHTHARAFKMHQSINKVAALTIVPALDLIDAFVAAVVGTSVFARQVTNEFAARWREIQLSTHLKRAARVLEKASQQMFRMAKQCGEAELLAAMQAILTLHVESDRSNKYVYDMNVAKVLRTPFK